MKNKRQWILGGVAATLLIVALVFGNSAGYLGAFKLQTTKNTTGMKGTATTSTSDFSIDDVYTSVTSTYEYLIVTKCNNSSATATETSKLYMEVEMNGYEYGHGTSWTPTKAGTCETQQIIVGFPGNEFGTLVHGQSYLVTVTLDSTGLVQETNETNNVYTYTYTYTGDTIMSFGLSNIELSSDYSTLSADICRTKIRAKDTAATVNFTVNGHTQSTNVSLPSVSNDCATASVSADFGGLQPFIDYEVTVDSSVADATVTETVSMIADIEIRDAGLDGNELYAEVCGVGTAGDEIGTVRFTVIADDGSFDVFGGEKYAGIGAMPSHGACETYTVELTNAELDTIMERGAYLEAFVDYSIGAHGDDNFSNNTFFYFF